MSIESKAANTSIGSDTVQVTLTGSPVYCASGINAVYKESLYTVQYIGEYGYISVPVTFSYRVPVQTWNGSSYVLPSTSDTLRVYSPLKVVPSVNQLENSSVYGVGRLSVTGISLSCFGDVKNVSFTSNGSSGVTAYVDVIYKPGSRSITNSSLVLTVDALLTVVVGKEVNASISSYLTFTPKVLCTFGSSGAYTMRFYDYASGDVTVTDIKNQTDTLNDSIEKGNEIAEETKETTKGIFASIKDFFGSFFQNLINSVISLFVPSADEMSGLFDQLNQFFSDRFGFLYAPFDYIIRLLNMFLSGTGETSLTFPGFEIMGETVWEPYSYDFSSEPLVGTVFGYVRTGTGILLAGWFIMYLQDFFKERFGSS